VLVTFRIVQAAGAALMTPTSLSMVLATSSSEARESNVRVWTAIGGLMAALGPVVGGLLVAISWRWVFVINIPFGIAVLVLGWMRLPHVRGHRIRYPDALGAALVTAGVALLTLGLVKGAGWGWGSTQTIGVLVGSVAAHGVRATCLRRTQHKREQTRYSTVSCSGSRRSRARRWSQRCIRSPSAGSALLVLWFQNVWHWSALHTGLAIAPDEHPDGLCRAPAPASALDETEREQRDAGGHERRAERVGVTDAVAADVRQAHPASTKHCDSQRGC